MGGSRDVWGPFAEPVARVALRLGDKCDGDTLTNLSAGTRADDHLFVAGDERGELHRVPLKEGAPVEPALSLQTLLDLAEPDEEADLEGLAADDGWLWIVGSHARTRPKVKRADGDRIDLGVLADLKRTTARCLLARAPLLRGADGWTPVREDGERRAGLLRQGGKGNAVARALRRNPLTRPFTRIPAKEGGVDVEGIAVCGDRVALGMRGPIVATNALILELTVEAKASGRLKLASDPVVRLLAMEGLGVRDLKRCGDDLLILAGPTTGLDGPCALYRWRGWALDPPQDARVVRLHRPERVLDLPFGRGVDHPEGLALWPDGKQVLVIYDSPADWRVDRDAGTIQADLFDLPG